jgi:hypothetical protein
MVLLMEFESDGISRLGGNGARLEGEDTSTTYDNTVVGTSGSW